MQLQSRLDDVECTVSGIGLRWKPYDKTLGWHCTALVDMNGPSNYLKCISSLEGLDSPCCEVGLHGLRLYLQGSKPGQITLA
jgi:hypothetical protein